MKTLGIKRPTQFRKILVVCMFDSIHSARWLAQFAGDTNFKICLFPSKKFKRINPSLIDLLKNTHNIQIAKFYFWVPKFLLGYYTYFRFSLISKIFVRYEYGFRKNSLTKTYLSELPDVVHALEIQGAGYLVCEALKGLNKPEKLILTNWGSDIYYYLEDASEKAMIKECLEIFKYYSAECQRDYELALNLGFQGHMLPRIPNGGGIEKSKFFEIANLCSERDLVVVKAYGNEFGLGKIAVSICTNVLVSLPEPKFFFYSVTKDIEPILKALVKRFPGRVEYATVRNSLRHEDLLKKFKTARCYLGMSRSDGISTSFLESLAYGAFPIQTDTSCAAEWIDLGAIGFITSSHKVTEIVEKIQEIFSSDDLVDNAQSQNRQIAEKYLDFELIQDKAKLFYS